MSRAVSRRAGNASKPGTFWSSSNDTIEAMIIAKPMRVHSSALRAPIFGCELIRPAKRPASTPSFPARQHPQRKLKVGRYRDLLSGLAVARGGFRIGSPAFA